MLSVVQRLGRLRHQTRSAYKLRTEIDELQLKIAQQQKHMEQTKTIVAIQMNDIRLTIQSVKDAGKYTPPANLVYICSEIARREDELAESAVINHETTKQYAYKLYSLQKLHNSIIDLAQTTEEDARLFSIPFDFRVCYQAVQDTSFTEYDTNSDEEI
jgi:hypothetical protein